jgi:uncharacterized protein (DUF39 family)
MSETKKTWDEINAKIAAGGAVVVTAEQAAAMSAEMPPAELAKKVDVVTTGTFGAMCSSGVFLNFGHPEPPIRMERLTLDGVPAYGGVAAVDAYVGVTETHPDDPRFGGAQVLEALVAGREVLLRATAKGTDCYPRKEIETWVQKDRINEMILANPRNAYQNYPAAANLSAKTLHTYMGTLLPGGLNVNYSTSGCLSPLLNDPYLRTIGIGTPVFLGGARGAVAWNGTQFNTEKPRNDRGLPLSNAATLMLVGDAKQMSTEWLRGAYFEKYGTTLYLGVGFAIPVLDEDMAYRVGVTDAEIETTVCDYGADGHPSLRRATYAELMSGSLELRGRKARTAPLSSRRKAREIAEELARRVAAGRWPLVPPSQALPAKSSVRGLEIVGRRPS